MDFKKTNQLVEKLSKEINSINKDILIKFPIEQYIYHLQKTKKYAPYKTINKKNKQISKQITELVDESLLGLYHKLVLVKLICDAETNYKEKIISDDLIKINFNYFFKIITRIGSEEGLANSKYYQFKNDKFIKDLGICRFSLILAGPVLLDAGWFPLKYLLKKGIMPFIKAIIVILKYNCLLPVLKMHTHISNTVVMSNFSEEGWLDFYKNIVDIIEMNSHYKGIYCAGWFFDPALEKISPEIGYLNKYVTMLDGIHFYLGSDPKIVKDATFLNQNRKKLYQEGKYMPSRYVIFIPSSKLIKWRKSQK